MTCTRTRLDLAVARGGDLPAHQVVAGEPGAHQVLRAVLHPLHRLAGEDRADHGAHVAGIDRHLVAEAAPDVGRDDADLVLRQARHDRVERAVGVRRLRRRPERQLAGHAVAVGDRAAGLHGRRVAARVDACPAPTTTSAAANTASVAALSPASQSKMWLSVLPSRSSRITGASASSAWRASSTGGSASYSTSISSSASRARSGRRRRRTRPPGPGSAPCPWPARPDVARQRRHPGELQPLQVLAGDDGVHLRMLQGGGGVDRDDAGVRERAAQHRAVQHAGQRRRRRRRCPGRG